MCAIMTLIIYPSSLYEAISFSVLVIAILSFILYIFRVILNKFLNVLLCKTGTETTFVKKKIPNLNSALFCYDNVRNQFILAPESLAPERMLIFPLCPQAVDWKDASMYV